MGRPVYLTFLALASCLAGCGPLRTPMVPRPDDEMQQRIDDAWEAALSPVDRVDHQRFLDVFVGTGAYQYGVDKLAFRSEKRFSGGTVIMEVTFDRAEPAKDGFVVTVHDKAGKEVRRESYGRKEVEQTYQELFVNGPPHQGNPAKAEPPEAMQKRAAYQARWAKIEELFPKPKEDPK